MRKPEYAQYIEHSLLKPEATSDDIKRLCEEAEQYKFAAVAIMPSYVKYAASLLKGTGVKVGAAIGFPLGAHTAFVKEAETRDAIANGANEVDMIVNIGAVKDKRYDDVECEISAVVNAAHPNVPVKVILETYLLTEDEKIRVCEIAAECGADYVKTCTGFNGGKATAEDIFLMKKAVGDRCAIKASTGIKTREDFESLLKAGAVRFGTSSGKKIVDGD